MDALVRTLKPPAAAEVDGTDLTNVSCKFDEMKCFEDQDFHDVPTLLKYCRAMTGYLASAFPSKYVVDGKLIIQDPVDFKHKSTLLNTSFTRTATSKPRRKRRENVTASKLKVWLKSYLWWKLNEHTYTFSSTFKAEWNKGWTLSVHPGDGPSSSAAPSSGRTLGASSFRAFRSFASASQDGRRQVGVRGKRTAEHCVWGRGEGGGGGGGGGGRAKKRPRLPLLRSSFGERRERREKGERGERRERGGRGEGEERGGIGTSWEREREQDAEVGRLVREICGDDAVSRLSTRVAPPGQESQYLKLFRRAMAEFNASETRVVKAQALMRGALVRRKQQRTRSIEDGSGADADGEGRWREEGGRQERCVSGRAAAGCRRVCVVLACGWEPRVRCRALM
eukprot:448136-Rhodomonas_salina.2